MRGRSTSLLPSGVNREIKALAETSDDIFTHAYTPVQLSFMDDVL